MFIFSFKNMMKALKPEAFQLPINMAMDHLMFISVRCDTLDTTDQIHSTFDSYFLVNYK